MALFGSIVNVARHFTVWLSQTTRFLPFWKRLFGALDVAVNGHQLFQPCIVGLTDAGHIGVAGLAGFQPRGLLVLQFAAIAHWQETGDQIEGRHHLHVKIVQRAIVADGFLIGFQIGFVAIETGRVAGLR